MKLKPVTKHENPDYPEAPAWRTGLLRWTKKMMLAASTAAAMSLGGCYDATAIADDSDETEESENESESTSTPAPTPVDCEFEPRLSGFAPPTQYFACESDASEPEPIEPPLELGGGQLCPPESSFASFTLEERTMVRIGLADYGGLVELSLVDESDRVLLELGPGESCAELEIDPGHITLRADPATDDPNAAYFELYVDVLPHGE